MKNQITAQPRSRAPPILQFVVHTKKQIGDGKMKENTKCFILASAGYEEITYATLEARRLSNPSYKNKRFVWLHGMLMEVSESDYSDFYRDVRRRKYVNEEAARNGAFSYHALDSKEMSGEEIIVDNSPPIDEEVSDKLLKEEMLSCIDRLDEDEQKLLSALYVENRSERLLAEELGITHQAVNKRRQKIIAKLKKMMSF